MTIFDEPSINPLPAGVVVVSYIPGPGQSDPVAAARATQLGVSVASRTVGPAFAPYVGTLPGIRADDGATMFGYLRDDGSPTKASVSAFRNDCQAIADDRATRYGNKQSNRGSAAWAMMDKLQMIMNRPVIPGGALTIAQLSDAVRKNLEDLQFVASNQRKILRWLGDQWDQPN